MMMSLKRNMAFALLLAALLTLSGCAGNAYVNSANENDEDSLLFGYIDMSDAPTKLEWVRATKVAGDDKGHNYSFGIHDGMFFNTYAGPGSYKFTSFGGAPFFGNVSYTFQFPTQGRGEMDPVVEEPGIYYVGSYKFKPIKAEWYKFWKPDKFTLERLESSAEKEMLERLLARTKSKYWRGRIEAHLREISSVAGR